MKEGIPGKQRHFEGLKRRRSGGKTKQKVAVEVVLVLFRNEKYVSAEAGACLTTTLDLHTSSSYR
jgi:hypothetical protein